MALKRRRLAGVGALAVAAAVAVPTSGAVAGPPAAGNPNLVTVQVLSFNDYHGHLEATDAPLALGLDPSQTKVGGVEYLSTRLSQLRAKAGAANSLTVAAGDLIGGSPFLSGMFHDEPSVESLNTLGLDVSGVGNHEFDEGTYDYGPLNSAAMRAPRSASMRACIVAGLASPSLPPTTAKVGGSLVVKSVCPV